MADRGRHARSGPSPRVRAAVSYVVWSVAIIAIAAGFVFLLKALTNDRPLQPIRPSTSVTPALIAPASLDFFYSDT